MTGLEEIEQFMAAGTRPPASASTIRPSGLSKTTAPGASSRPGASGRSSMPATNTPSLSAMAMPVTSTALSPGRNGRGTGWHAASDFPC